MNAAFNRSVVRSVVAAGALAVVVGAFVGFAGAKSAARMTHPVVEALPLPALDRLVVRLAANARAAQR